MYKRQSRRLALYFGDEQAPERCGHCSVCQGHVTTLPQPPELPPLSGRDAQALGAAFVEKHRQYAGHEPSHECLTRFLCGVTTPLFTKLKARQLAGFAALEEYPYAEVRDWLTASFV